MKQRKTQTLLVACLCGLSLLTLSLAYVSSQYALNWFVIGGGGRPVSSASYAVNGTLGQAVVGSSANTSYEIGAGYWYGIVEAAPTITPTPTATSTSTATPTGTATPTATPTSTPTPTPTGTVTPPAHPIYLPIITKNTP